MSRILRVGNIYGMDSGEYDVRPEYLLGNDLREYDWFASEALSSQNDWANYCIEGATEFHPGFLRAVRELQDVFRAHNFWFGFDGPWIQLDDLVAGIPVRWYHGTSTAVLPAIQDQGLVPRKITGSPEAYGAGFTTAPPGDPDAVYLTTQLTMAQSAARQAARILGGKPVILEVVDLDWKHNSGPDVDSREPTAERSLWRMGSIAYYSVIPPEKLVVV